MQDEPGHFAAGEMHAGSAGDGPLGSAEDAGVGFPGLETAGVGTRPQDGGAGGGREDVAPIKEAAAHLVEVVGVVFMGEEDCVDVGEIGEGERGIDGVAKGDVGELDGEGRGGEEGVGEEGGAGGFENGRGGADVSDLEVAEGRHCDSLLRMREKGRKGLFYMLYERERCVIFLCHCTVVEPRTTARGRMAALMIATDISGSAVGSPRSLWGDFDEDNAQS